MKLYAHGLSWTLDRPIAFHRCFVNLTGDVLAALMLSQAVYWQLRAQGEGGWWWKTMEDWEAETGMSRRQQERARKILSRFPWWHEERRGVPARLWFRVDTDRLIQDLAEFGAGMRDGQECAEPPGQFVRSGQTGMSESAKLSTETTSETTTERFPPSDEGGGAADAALSALRADPHPPEARLLRSAVEIWNRVCGDVLPRVSKLSQQRRRLLRKRLVDDCKGDLRAWESYCRRIRASAFCCGHNDRGWVADIEFALRAGSWLKVHEGKYDNRPGVGTGGAPSAVRSYVNTSRQPDPWRLDDEES